MVDATPREPPPTVLTDTGEPRAMPLFMQSTTETMVLGGVTGKFEMMPQAVALGSSRVGAPDGACLVPQNGNQSKNGGSLLPVERVAVPRADPDSNEK